VCDDGDLLLGDVVEVDEVLLRPVGDGDHVVGVARGAWDDGLEDEPVAARHQLGLALEGEVVHGQDGHADGPKRQRVLVMAEPRPHVTQEPRELPRHAHLLGARGKLDRLDAGWNPVGVPCHRSEAEVWCHRGQLAEEVLDVRLVARPLPSENVGIEKDVDHAAASR
jgi:hypothetical protein